MAVLPKGRASFTGNTFQAPCENDSTVSIAALVEFSVSSVPSAQIRPVEICAHLLRYFSMVPLKLTMEKAVRV